MNVVADPRPVAGADAQPQPVDAVLRNHPAFCQLALPVRSSKGLWRRDVAGASVAIEAGASLDSGGEHREAGLPIPTGKFVRLLLLHICDAAIRADSAVVELGASARDFAEGFDPEIKGPKLRELTDQLDRVLAARITVSLDDGPAQGMFDARGRPRGSAPVWRPSVRLNSKFLAALIAHPVALDRRVVAALADAPMALDAYGWLSFIVPRLGAGAASFATWDDLMARFAPASQPPDEFRAAFEQSLRQVSELCPHVSLVIREHGLECRLSARRMMTAAVAPAIAEPAPVATHAPEAETAAPLATHARKAETAAEPAEAAEAADQMVRDIVAEIASSIVAPPEPPREPSPGAEIPSRTAFQPGAPLGAPLAAPSGAPLGALEPMRQTISLKSHLTGLGQVIWLQRANGRDNLVIEVTPGGRYDPENATVLALEPMILQIAGGLQARDFERVTAWANANRDLIDEFWEGKINSFEEITRRVKTVPPPGWR